MAQKKKQTRGNPAVQNDSLTTEMYAIVKRSVEITQKLQDDPRITQEQWEYFRGGVLASMSIYGILLGKDPAFTIIIDEYDKSMLCPTCTGPHRTVKGIECPTCGCPPRD